ncbi:hypothetical protein FKJ92_19160 [Klebsiella pneumoniae]|uniref:hypothetical protein n=1 Tax=Enterobacteriaceae TaxID=543 RepID=UPI000EAF907A|nr:MULTISPECIES: hypothetical protein [Enterobacteriaceae]HDT4993413.1 hypothetical protein [Enterobacter hormaechei subsp. xiangfangensis]AYJ97853.1 hypothetical protein D9K63_05105 [Klebsiella pneumoniae]KAA5649718.1 hypothetical protein F3G26_25340 [Klebsiella pneumoniae]MBK3214915.1 hypothetical protein [Klebsiella pneumoniae]MBK3231168.1 hypothetical protein [Klebsiella pneumoniae]
MSVIETLRELSEVWRLFSDMPDDATLNVELASLYLGISVKSLARYRQNGGGPQYIQYQSEDSKARNQRINYLLRDLRSWRDDHKVSNTMHAAQIRGLTFASLSDFTEPQPFWQMITNGCSKNKLISHALTTPDDIFRQLLEEPNKKVIWTSVEEALFMDWINVDERKRWNDLFNEVLNYLIKSANAALEKQTIETALNLKGM